MAALEDVWAEIETDYAWRSDEIRFFQNQLRKIESSTERDQFRRALVLILYSHFEGFCKFAFTLYVNIVNKQGIRCEEANSSIAAASLADMFDALRNNDKKSDLFRANLPTDEKLHRFAREKDFIDQSHEFNRRLVFIPEDVVDTESNLKPVVLRKNLFRLGFRHDSFEPIEGDISKLLNYRNKIAHGAMKDGISEKAYESLSKAAFTIMDEIKHLVMQALTEKEYLRAS